MNNRRAEAIAEAYELADYCRRAFGAEPNAIVAVLIGWRQGYTRDLPDDLLVAIASTVVASRRMRLLPAPPTRREDYRQ